MKQSLDKKWCIAQIKPNSYRSAIQNLERQGFQTFFHKIEITRRQENKFVVNNAQVFPGYMCVCFDPHSINQTKINSTYGVSKILTFNKIPSEIPSDLILELKTKYENNDNRKGIEKLQNGDSIKINNGPFASLIARIEAVDDKNRIWLVLEAMGQHKKLKIQQTEKLNFTKV